MYSYVDTYTHLYLKSSTGSVNQTLLLSPLQQKGMSENFVNLSHILYTWNFGRVMIYGELANS